MRSICLVVFGFQLFSGPAFASAYDECAADLIRAADALQAAVAEMARAGERYAKLGGSAGRSQVSRDVKRWIKGEFEKGRSQEDILSTRILGSSLSPSVQRALVEDFERVFHESVEGDRTAFRVALRNYIGPATDRGDVGGAFATIGDIDGMVFLSEQQDERMHVLSGDATIQGYLLKVSKRAFRERFGEELLQATLAELNAFGFDLAD